MRKLIKKMPNVAEDVFVKCISTNGKNPEDIRYEVRNLSIIKILILNYFI